MLILITYDVNTESPSGANRLRRVAKECTNYGHRVQNSVFECQVNNAEYRKVKFILLQIIDSQRDSIRFYNLGNNYRNRVETFGKSDNFDAAETMIF